MTAEDRRGMYGVDEETRRMLKTNSGMRLMEPDTRPIEDKIYDFVEGRGGGVSFAEITTEFGECDSELTMGDDNLIIWQRLTEECASGICNLLNSKSIVFCSCSPLVYAVDGKMLKLPIAKSWKRGHYKRPHWMCVVINTHTQYNALPNKSEYQEH